MVMNVNQFIYKETDTLSKISLGADIIGQASDKQTHTHHVHWFTAVLWMLRKPFQLSKLTFQI